MDLTELNNKKPKIDYEANLRRVLGWENEDMKILKKSAGLLKGVLKRTKQTPLSIQRKARKEWDGRLEKLSI